MLSRYTILLHQNTHKNKKKTQLNKTQNSREKFAERAKQNKNKTKAATGGDNDTETSWHCCHCHCHLPQTLDGRLYSGQAAHAQWAALINFVLLLVSLFLFALVVTLLL